MADEYAENNIDLDCAKQRCDNWNVCLGQTNGSSGAASDF